MNLKNKYSIKIISQKTGLSTHVIRAWEKRYNFLSPERTKSNRRLYSDEDLEHLCLLARATREGYTIGSLASLTLSELKQLNKTPALEPKNAYDDQNEIKDHSDIEDAVNNCLSAIQKLDTRQFELELMRASVDFSQPVLLESVIVPLLKTIGELWKEGRLRIIHEHFATAVLKPFLFNLKKQHNPPTHAPVIIITTPLGQHHELGALILSVVASAQGWQVTYLGSDLPAEEIVAAARGKNAKAVSLSIVYPQNDPQLNEELLRLGQLMPKHVRILAGGRAVDSYSVSLSRIDSVIIHNFTVFREILDELE